MRASSKLKMVVCSSFFFFFKQLDNAVGIIPFGYDSSDFCKGKTCFFESSNMCKYCDLFLGVISVSGKTVDISGDKQPLLVIMTQHRYFGVTDFRKLADSHGIHLALECSEDIFCSQYKPAVK